MDPTLHEKEICSAIAGLWPAFRGSNGDWTRATFEALQDLGSRFGYESRYSARCGGSGEWLWDFLWCERDPGSGHIVSLPLVAESEWSKATLRHDFEKLLVADAPLKLIILQKLTDEQLKTAIAELRSYSLSYRGNSGLYLAAGWVYGGSAPHPSFESWRNNNASAT
jgi:hypothetical protein